MLGLETDTLVNLAGLACGLGLGLAARLGRFCIMGAIEDASYGANLSRLRMVALALAVAITGTWIAITAGGVLPEEIPYLVSSWSLIGAVLGGSMFGFGMALVGTCGFGALARLGGGDLRSLVTVVAIGVSAYVTLNGPLEAVRLALVPPGEGGDSLAQSIGSILSLPPLAVALSVSALFFGFAFWRGTRSMTARMLIAGISVGFLVPCAWLVTSWASEDGFAIIRVEAFTFVAPLGESILYLMSVSDLSLPGFGISTVLGVVLGACIGAGLKHEFRWESCDDPRDLKRQLLGAVLMGCGGILALGCTIGQGISAFSVLAPSAPIAALSILIGARVGLYVLVEGRSLKHFLRRIPVE